ncbi:MAG: glycosyltransferase family 61 protein [Puniceicoccales bacterium]
METNRKILRFNRKPPTLVDDSIEGDFARFLGAEIPTPEIVSYQGVRVTGMGLLVDNGRILPESFPDHLEGKGWKLQYDEYHQPIRWIKSVAGAYLKPTEHVAEPALWVTDTWADSFFFWLTEVLPRLVFARSQLGPEVPLYFPGAMYSIPFIKESLDILGERPKLIPPGEVRKFADLHIPLRMAAIHDMNPLWVNETGKRLREHLKVDRVPGRRVNISRRQARKRKLENQDAVEAILEKHGFENVVMESLSMTEQLKLMAETSVLCALHGAGLSHMLAMPPGGTVIEIQPRGGINSSFFNLADACGHRYIFVQSEVRSESDKSIHADSWLEPDVLEQALSLAGVGKSSS